MFCVQHMTIQGALLSVRLEKVICVASDSVSVKCAVDVMTKHALVSIVIEQEQRVVGTEISDRIFMRLRRCSEESEGVRAWRLRSSWPNRPHRSSYRHQNHLSC